MIHTLDIVGYGLVIAGIAIAIWWFVIAWRYRSYVNGFVYARGANVAGSAHKARLQCGSGKKICMNKATVVCSVPQPHASTWTNPSFPSNFETAATDPIASGLDGNAKYGEYNPKTTLNVVDKMKNECNGKGQCTFDFSNETLPNGIHCSADNTQLLSTYYCVDEGADCPV